MLYYCEGLYFNTTLYNHYRSSLFITYPYLACIMQPVLLRGCVKAVKLRKYNKLYCDHLPLWTPALLHLYGMLFLYMIKMDKFKRPALELLLKCLYTSSYVISNYASPVLSIHSSPLRLIFAVPSNVLSLLLSVFSTIFHFVFSPFHSRHASLVSWRRRTFHLVVFNLPLVVSAAVRHIKRPAKTACGYSPILLWLTAYLWLCGESNNSFGDYYWCARCILCCYSAQV